MIMASTVLLVDLEVSDNSHLSTYYDMCKLVDSTCYEGMYLFGPFHFQRQNLISLKLSTLVINLLTVLGMVMHL